MQHTEQGVAIRAARIAKNMTQAHLAGVAGISEKTVRRAESGERIHAESVRSLCAALGLDAENLRSEAELIPQAGVDMEERLQLRAFATRAGVSVLAASVTLTMAYMVFDGFALPQGLGRALNAACIVAGAAAFLILFLAMIPATRRRLLALSPTGNLANGLDIGFAVVSFVVVLAIVPPMICVGLYGLRDLIAEPTWTGAGYLAFIVYVGYGMPSRLMAILTGEAMDEGPAETAGAEPAAA